MANIFEVFSVVSKTVAALISSDDEVIVVKTDRPLKTGETVEGIIEPNPDEKGHGKLNESDR